MANAVLMTGLGAALAIFLSSAGSSYASYKGGLMALHGPMAMKACQMRRSLHGGVEGDNHHGSCQKKKCMFGMLKHLIMVFGPIIIAGVLAIYGLIVGILLSHKMHGSNGNELTEAEGYKNLAAGLVVGLACLVSGIGMGSMMDAILMYGRMMFRGGHHGMHPPPPFHRSHSFPTRDWHHGPYWHRHHQHETSPPPVPSAEAPIEPTQQHRAAASPVDHDGHHASNTEPLLSGNESVGAEGDDRPCHMGGPSPPPPPYGMICGFKLMMSLVFLEAIGLYGLVAALFMMMN